MSSQASTFSMMSSVFIGWYLVNRLLVSMMSWVLIGGVLSTVSLSPYCQGYSLGVSCQPSLCLHDIKSTHWGCLVNRLFVSMVSMVLIGWYLVNRRFCLHDVKGTQTLTPFRPQGYTLIFSSYVGYRSPPKNIRNFKHPKNCLKI